MTQWTSPSSWEIIVEMTYEKKMSSIRNYIFGFKLLETPNTEI